MVACQVFIAVVFEVLAAERSFGALICTGGIFLYHGFDGVDDQDRFRLLIVRRVFLSPKRLCLACHLQTETF